MKNNLYSNEGEIGLSQIDGKIPSDKFNHKKNIHSHFTLCFEKKKFEEESNFEDDCMNILEDEKNICLFFPQRSAENSPRSKILMFQLTEELIETFPELRTILAPLTITNATIFVIEPIFNQIEKSESTSESISEEDEISELSSESSDIVDDNLTGENMENVEDEKSGDIRENEENEENVESGKNEENGENGENMTTLFSNLRTNSSNDLNLSIKQNEKIHFFNNGDENKAKKIHSKISSGLKEFDDTHCIAYVIYGNSIYKHKVRIESSIEAFQTYLTSSLKTFPFTAELHINEKDNTINNMSAKEFLEHIRSIYSSNVNSPRDSPRENSSRLI